MGWELAGSGALQREVGGELLLTLNSIDGGVLCSGCVGDGDDEGGRWVVKLFGDAWRWRLGRRGAADKQAKVRSGQGVSTEHREQQQLQVTRFSYSCPGM